LQLILVEKLIQRRRLRIILLILLLHNLNVVDEFEQKVLHPFGGRLESNNLMVGLAEVTFGYLPQNSIKTHISLQARLNVEFFPLEPRKLFVYVLLWEHEDLKFFRFEQIGTLCQLFDKLAQQVHPLVQKIFLFVSKGALFWQSWDVEAWKSFRKGISQSQKVLISALNLERL